MRTYLMAGVAAVSLLTAGSASAQIFGISPPDGVYVAGDVGYHQAEEYDGSSNTRYNWDFNSESDYAAFVKLGYRISPNFRVELEGGYRPGDIDSVRGTGPAGLNGNASGLCRAGILRTAAAPACISPEGDLRASTIMVNGIYDLFDETARFRPFVGVGVGFAEVHNKVYGQLAQVPSGLTPASFPFQNVSIDDMDTGFAYQGLIGVAYNLTDRLALDLTGRYTAADELEFGSVTTNNGAATPGTIANTGTFEGDYRDVSVSLGLRYSFGATTPAPEPMQPEPPMQPQLPPEPPMQPPVVQAPVSQEFIVYFPFDQYVLTSEAQAVIQQAASYAQQGTPTSVVLVGHTDTSGSAQYNVRLSERRAKAVADSLVGMGVNQGALQVDFRGESQPAVATPDGTKEPLNRRTTIGINF